MSLQFFTEEITFSLKNKASLRRWIMDVVKCEKKAIGDINFVFCSDQYLLQINKKYLKHDYFTDIITFQHDIEVQSTKSKVQSQASQDSRLKTQNSPISGDIFISIDRVKENAEKYKVSFNTELHRVMIHGVLHLLGYKDKAKAAKKVMTKKEDLYLNLLAKK